MINVAKLSPKDRQEVFRIAADELKINEGIIEKDFYVVLILNVLFHRIKYGKHFAFKGGTSLSKAYDIIKRFSEDIDVVMNWELLGYSNKEMWEERSKRKQVIFNKEINDKAVGWIRDNLLTEFKRTLGRLGLEEFNVYIKENEKQTIIVEYPKSFSISGILPEIRLEIGPLAAWAPSTKKNIMSYTAKKLPNIFEQANIEIPTIAAKRTFWEKATILHKEAHRRNNRTPKRYSRHYYDLVLLSNTDVKTEALSDKTLLKEVVEFKKKFYMDNSAKYDQAFPGTFALLPRDIQLEALEKDYQDMQAMFFETAPRFDEILESLTVLEDEINNLADTKY